MRRGENEGEITLIGMSRRAPRAAAGLGHVVWVRDGAWPFQFMVTRVRASRRRWPGKKKKKDVRFSLKYLGEKVAINGLFHCRRPAHFVLVANKLGLTFLLGARADTMS